MNTFFSLICMDVCIYMYGCMRSTGLRMSPVALVPTTTYINIGFEVKKKR